MRLHKAGRYMNSQYLLKMITTMKASQDVVCLAEMKVLSQIEVVLSYNHKP